MSAIRSGKRSLGISAYTLDSRDSIENLAAKPTPQAVGCSGLLDTILGRLQLLIVLFNPLLKLTEKISPDVVVLRLEYSSD